MLPVDKAKIEAPYPVHFWGRDCLCEPKFVEEALGDGKVLLGYQPLSTRPSYYVIRVDSFWHLDGCRRCENGCPDSLMEHIDEIEDAIEEQYGETQGIRYNNENEREDGEEPESTDWPVLDLSCGSSWFILDPAKYFQEAA